MSEEGDWEVVQRGESRDRYIYSGADRIAWVKGEGNANLIAKAPKMCEALGKIVAEGTRCAEEMRLIDKPVRSIYNIDLVDRIARQAIFGE